MQAAIHYHTSPRMKDFLKGKEKLVLVAYPDPKTGGVPWTLGYGSTRGVHEGMRWTRDQAEAAFEDDLGEAEVQVYRNVRVPITQGMFDALTSIIFNVGAGSSRRDGIIRLKDGRPSTLLRKLNDSDYTGCREQFTKWVSPGSNVERGLTIRRNEEVSRFWDV